MSLFKDDFSASLTPSDALYQASYNKLLQHYAANGVVAFVNQYKGTITFSINRPTNFDEFILCNLSGGTSPGSTGTLDCHDSGLNGLMKFYLCGIAPSFTIYFYQSTSPPPNAGTCTIVPEAMYTFATS